MRTTKETEKEVQAAIVDLREAFGRYHLRAPIDCCAHCTSEADQRELQAAPSEVLSDESLEEFAFRAMTTWGNEQDFKHFLPRILALMLIDGGFFYVDAEVVFGKLQLANCRFWREAEQEALRRYFRAGWHHILCQEKPRIAPCTWLVGIMIAGESPMPFLKEWVTFRTITAYKHLSALLDDWYVDIIYRRKTSPLLRAPEEIRRFLMDPATRAQLETLFFENEAEEYSSSLAEVVDSLERIARS